MIFGPCPPLEAEGCLLAHRTRLGDRTLKKGHVLSARDCAALASAGVETVVVARLEPDDLDEDSAAARIGRAAVGPGIAEETAFTGRMNLYADTNGVLVVDPAAVNAANRIDPAITFATLENHARVTDGRMVATAKIIAFAVPAPLVKHAEDAIRGAVRVASFSPRKVGLVATELPHLKPSTMDKTRRVLEDRLRPSGSSLLAELRVPHRGEAVSAAMQDLVAKGADFLVLFGASAVVDRKDVLPAALDLAGGTVRHLGMPVDPGNLLMLGELRGVPVLGAPGCARSPKENGFDWVLDRLLAGLKQRAKSETDIGRITAEAGLPTGLGLEQYRKGNYASAFTLLTSARDNLYLVGGSHAQRDVFERITIDAALRAGLPDDAERLIKSRSQKRGALDRFAEQRLDTCEKMYRAQEVMQDKKLRATGSV